MMGTLTTVASLTICLAMTNAFVLRVPKVAPPAGAAWTKQASVGVGAPLANEDKTLGAGSTLSRIGGDDAGEASGQHMPWMPYGGGYGALSKRSICPLGVFQGVQPEITQDDNVTVPIVGGVGSEDGESTKPDIIQDSNATVPIIVGGVGNEEGRDSGVTSVLQDDEGVVRHRITVTMEELTTHQHFFGEEQSVMVIASDARESASKTQADDDDSTHGGSDDTDLATNADLSTDANHTTTVDITTDANIATVADITTIADSTTDDDLELLNQEQLSHDASADAIAVESPHTMTGDDPTFDEDVPFELTADGVAAEVSLIVEDAGDDTMGSVPHDIADAACHEDPPFDLAGNDLIGEMGIWPFGPELAEYAVDHENASVPHEVADGVFPEDLPFDLAGNDLIDQVSIGEFDLMMTEHAVGLEMMPAPHHGISDEAASQAAIFDGAMDEMIWSVLEDALTRGLRAEDLMLDVSTDNLMWAKLYDAISGRGRRCELADALDEVTTSLLHNSFFGPATSEAVSKLAKSDDDRELMVDDYAQAVAVLYNKFKWVRCRTSTDRAHTIRTRPNGMLEDTVVDDAMGSVSHDIDGSAFFIEELPFHIADDSELIDQMNIWLFGPDFAEYAVDLKMPSVLHDTADSAFDEEHQLYLAAADHIDEMSVKPFDPVLEERAAVDGSTSVLYEDVFDVPASEAVFFDDPANDLVFSVVCDGLARGTASEGLMLDPAMDAMMRSKLHDALCGRAASEAVGLADALDDMITNLLHDAFFGPEASKAVFSLIKSADDGELVVDEYVQTVAKLYDKFKKARSSSPDREAPAVGKALKGAGGWIKKLWKRVRRKGR